MSRIARTSVTGLVALALVGASVPLARAQDSGRPPKIGVVDLQRALVTSKEGKETKARLEAEVTKAQTQLDQMSKELNKLKDDLDKQKLTLSDDAAGEKQRELESKQREAVRFRSDVLDELKRKEGEATQHILKSLAEIVEKIGKDQGYSLVFEQHNLLYADTGYDLTDDVIKRFDAEGPARPAAPPSKPDAPSKSRP